MTKHEGHPQYRELGAYTAPAAPVQGEEVVQGTSEIASASVRSPNTEIASPEQIADAIEILDMCKPIRDADGGMWFGRNDRYADATFVDYGACRAFAIAARALPHLVTQNAAILAEIKACHQRIDELTAEKDNLKYAISAISDDAKKRVDELESVLRGIQGYLVDLGITEAEREMLALINETIGRLEPFPAESGA